MKNLLKKIKTVVDIKLIKFIIVGVINTLVGSAIMFGLYNLAHCSYWFSSASNYVLTSILSFFLNKHFTFNNKENSLKQVVLFIINIVVCYLVAYGLAQPLVSFILSGSTITIRENISMLVGMVLFTGLNYLGQRFFTFK